MIPGLLHQRLLVAAGVADPPAWNGVTYDASKLTNAPTDAVASIQFSLSNDGSFGVIDQDFVLLGEGSWFNPSGDDIGGGYEALVSVSQTSGSGVGISINNQMSSYNVLSAVRTLTISNLVTVSGTGRTDTFDVDVSIRPVGGGAAVVSSFTIGLSADKEF
jgi:hypothetical protein